MEIDLIKLILDKYKLDEIAELIPGWLHLNNSTDLGLEYMSPKMERDFKISTPEVRKIGLKFLFNCIHPETSERVVPQLLELVQKGDAGKILSFYQFIKLPDKEEYEWYLTTSKLFNGDTVISTTIPLSVLQDFDGYITGVLNENLFLKSNLETYDKLTKREKEIIKILVKGNSNMQIAETLNISEYTIKTHRQNIYRKLQISNIVELVRFANVFGIM